MSKTALALNIATRAAGAHSVMIFSLEMSKIQFKRRFISSESRINATRVQNRIFTDGEWATVVRAVESFSNLKLFINDTVGITLTELKTKARKIKREHGLELIVIDYLQLIQCDDRYRGNRMQEVSEISRELKALAHELDISVLALAQLSRAVEMRAEKKPQLLDLRDSGAIEQDADIVMFLYHDEYYGKNSNQKKTAELIIAKNRNGATGSTYLKFEKDNVYLRHVFSSNKLRKSLN